MNFEQPRPRVNGAMLSKFQGQQVCLMGMAGNLSSNGMSFDLQTSDDMKVNVMLQEPVQEYIDGAVEVHGTVDQQRSQIQCHQYVNFSSGTPKFDMKTYDKAIEYMHRHPQHYRTGNPAPPMDS